MSLEPEAFIRAHTALRPAPLTPEISLYTADQLTPIWRLTEQALDSLGLAPPFWAFPWAGGQALARYVLDHPQEARGKAVFDFASGSGLCAIAAMKAGAVSAIGNDVDPLCAAAIALNAAANGVVVTPLIGDQIGAPPPAVGLILAGDICYEREVAVRVLAWLSAAHGAGCRVLIGDPGRSYFPRDGLRRLAAYDVPTTREIEDAEVKAAGVWTLV